MQISQISNSLNHREKGTFSSQPEPNPRNNQAHAIQSDQLNQANSVITLRSGKTISVSKFSPVRLRRTHLLA